MESEPRLSLNLATHWPPPRPSSGRGHRLSVIASYLSLPLFPQQWMSEGHRLCPQRGAEDGVVVVAPAISLPTKMRWGGLGVRLQETRRAHSHRGTPLSSPLLTALFTQVAPLASCVCACECLMLSRPSPGPGHLDPTTVAGLHRHPELPPLLCPRHRLPPLLPRLPPLLCLAPPSQEPELEQRPRLGSNASSSSTAVVAKEAVGEEFCTCRESSKQLPHLHHSWVVPVTTNKTRVCNVECNGFCWA